MDARNVLHMNRGDGKNSYAKNSLVQGMVITKTRPILEEAIKDMLQRNTMLTCFKIADLGCSSGPNTLLAVSNIIDTISQICQQKELEKTPDFQVFLNDLPGNDFNSLFNLLPDFYQRLEKENGRSSSSCFISGLPSSFYGRLFPSKSIHFVHSSNSLHWLPKVPENLVNKGDIYMGKSCPPEVCQAYLKQFQKYFLLFLSLRSEEMVSGGRMVLTFAGRNLIDPTSSRDCCYPWELLTKSLFELVNEGVIEEGDIDSINIPAYTPHDEELREIIEIEVSFSLQNLQKFEINWDPRDNENNEKNNFFVFNEFEVGNAVARMWVRIGF